jgi:hypothetical protein
MRRFSMLVSAGLAMGMILSLSPLSGCGGKDRSSFGDGGGGGASGQGGVGGTGGASGSSGAGGAAGSGGTAGISFMDSGGSGGAGGSAGTGDSGSGGIACPPGLMCNVACSGKTTTTVSGTVYDPAMLNPLYNISVYVPAVPLTPLPPGVPTGKDACSCGALYQSGAIVNTSTAVNGTFTLSNVPVGAKVPLVIQVGKWRKQIDVAVKSCQDNPQPDKSLFLPSTVPAGDTITNMPDIAVSTGNADTLECLMTRIGLPSTEYVAGTGSSGHVHIFAGGKRATLFGGGSVGKAETPAMSGAPVSSTDLWSTQAQLMPYDIVLLSCEGGETYNANPPALEAYLNAGGRAFGSHFHYAWFAGPIGSGQSYSAPADWGKNLATWSTDMGHSSGPIGGIIDTTLNGSTKPFAKGVALQQWLTDLGALGKGGVPSTELSIYQPRFNAVVGPTDTPSQPWITSDSSGISGETMYFSFDTPVTPPTPGQYCGRAVFSDLHVAGDPSTSDSSPPPGGCTKGPLSPQEKALEFMLFDLSSCVIPDTVSPPDAGTPLPPPPK